MNLSRRMNALKNVNVQKNRNFGRKSKRSSVSSVQHQGSQNDDIANLILVDKFVRQQQMESLDSTGFKKQSGLEFKGAAQEYTNDYSDQKPKNLRINTTKTSDTLMSSSNDYDLMKEGNLINRDKNMSLTRCYDEPSSGSQTDEAFERKMRK